MTTCQGFLFCGYCNLFGMVFVYISMEKMNIRKEEFEELESAKGYTENALRYQLQYGHMSISDVLRQLNRLHKVDSLEKYSEFCDQLEKLIKEN